MSDSRAYSRWGEVLVFGLFWLVFLAVGRHALFQDPGTLWHTEAGQRMLQQGEVLRHDPFGFESFGRPWIAMQWLIELGMAHLHAVSASFAGMWLMAGTLLALTYTLVWRNIVAQGGSLALATLLACMALAAGAHHFIARPHLFTLLFIVVLQATLMAWEERREAWRLMLLVPCFLFWVNAHGGALAGLCSAALVVGVESVRAARRGEERGLLPLAIVPLLLATSVVNPYGIDLPRTWVTLSSSPILPRIIEEHAPPNFHTIQPWLMLAFGVAYLSALVSVPRRELRTTYFLPLVWFALSLRSQRHIPLFAAVAAMTLPALAQKSAWVRALFARSALFGLRAPTLARFPWAISAQPFLVWAFVELARPSVAANLVGPPLAVAPVDTLPALREACSRVPDGSGVLNEMVHGGFLILHVPCLRVYIDDRWEVHGDDKLYAYVRDSELAPERLLERARELGIRVALAPRGTPLEAALTRSSDFRRTFAGETASVFERQRTP